MATALKPQTKTEIVKRFIFDAGSSIVSDTSPDRAALERQAKGLQAVFSHTRFLVVQGTQRPGVM
jgi:hypothetical protein